MHISKRLGFAVVIIGGFVALFSYGAYQIVEAAQPGMGWVGVLVIFSNTAFMFREYIFRALVSAFEALCRFV